MKKIVSAVSLATLLVGAAFAADISFSYTGANYFVSNGDNIAYDNASRWDCMSFGLSNDYAGAVVDFDIDASALTLDKYYGWMKFAQINTTFTAGVFAKRYVNRVVADAGDLDDEDFELKKPGVINGTVAADSDNLTIKKLAMFAEYVSTELLPGEFTAKFGLVNSDWDSFTKTDSDGTYTRKNYYGFAGEVGLKQEDSFSVNLAVRSLKAHNYSFGLFFSPLMIEKLQATAGFSLGLEGNSTYAAEGDTGVEYGADLRLRYEFSDKLSFTTMHNISSYLAGLDATDAEGKKWADNKMAIWNMFNVTYAFLDNMKFGLTLNHIMNDSEASYPEASKVIVSPSLAIAATEKANVTISARGTFDKIGFNTSYSDFNFVVPVIFSYNY